MAAFGKIKKGAFHRWLGKSADAPITAADIKRGLAAGGHAAKMASFARSAQQGKFRHASRTLRSRANAKLYSRK